MARSATRTARADWSLLRRPFFKPSDQNYACSARLNIFPFAARLFDPHFGHSVEIMTLDPQRRFARVRSPAIPRPGPTPRRAGDDALRDRPSPRVILGDADADNMYDLPPLLKPPPPP